MDGLPDQQARTRWLSPSPSESGLEELILLHVDFYSKANE